MQSIWDRLCMIWVGYEKYKFETKCGGGWGGVQYRHTLWLLNICWNYLFKYFLLVRPYSDSDSFYQGFARYIPYHRTRLFPRLGPILADSCHPEGFCNMENNYCLDRFIHTGWDRQSAAAMSARMETSTSRTQTLVLPLSYSLLYW